MIILVFHIPDHSALIQATLQRDLPKGNERKLLVDDEPQIIRMAGRILRQLGYTVTMRISSLDALSQ